MAKTFDATLKHLEDQFGADWAAVLSPYAGLPPGVRAEPLDSDLSVTSAQSDKLFRLSAPAEGLLHLELESAWAGDIPARLLLYSVLAEHRHGGPVYSLVILLRPIANATDVTGELVRSGAAGEYLRFRYRVVRLWELPSADLMAGPIGMLPLALLTNDAQPHLSDLVRQMDQRVRRELGDTADAETIRTACYLLLGMRYDKDTINRLFAGVTQMAESSTFQGLIDEGRQQGEVWARHAVLLKLGRKQLGPASAEAEAALRRITDIGRLDQMIDTLDQAADWEAWLQS
jgi:hypothetical protein